MKSGMIRGMVTGAVLGMAAVTAVGMMNPGAQRKLRGFVNESGRTLKDRFTQVMGK